MRSTLSLGERLTDLRIQKGLKQEEVAEALDLSRSAISKYENIDENNKNTIDHLSLIKFAKFYGVSADYLIGLDDNLTQKSTPISELHLSDDAIEEIKKQKFNNRLLGEIITHPDFLELIDDIEIYVNGYVEYRFNKLNAEVQTLRLQMEYAKRKYSDVEQTDRAIYEKAVKEGLIEETDFFSYKILEVLKKILKDLRNKHKHKKENMTTTKKDIYTDLSDEEIEDKFITYKAIKDGVDPEVLRAANRFAKSENPDDMDMQLVLDWLGLRNDALTREEFDFLYDILLKSDKVDKFSKRHKSKNTKKKDTN